MIIPGMQGFEETVEYSFQKQVCESKVWIRARGILSGQKRSIFELD